MKKIVLVVLLACAAMSFATARGFVQCANSACHQCNSGCVAKKKKAVEQGENFDLNKCTVDCINKNIGKE